MTQVASPTTLHECRHVAMIPAWLEEAIAVHDHLHDPHLECAMISETATTPTATREEEVRSEDIPESDHCLLLEPVDSLPQAIETSDLRLVLVAEQMVMQK